MDIGTISLILLLGMLFLLAIGMPLGFASGFLAVLVMVLKFEPTLLTDPFSFGSGILTSNFGSGPMNILAQRLYGITTNYVLISVPLFIFMATLLERSGIARDMYSCLSQWMSRTRGGIAVVTAIMAIVMAAMSGIIGGEVVLARPDRPAADAAPWLQPEPRHRHHLRIGLARHHDPAIHRADLLRPDHRNFDPCAVQGGFPARFHAGGLLHHLHSRAHPHEPGAGTIAGAVARRHDRQGKGALWQFASVSAGRCRLRPDRGKMAVPDYRQPVQREDDRRQHPL